MTPCCLSWRYALTCSGWLTSQAFVHDPLLDWLKENPLSANLPPEGKCQPLTLTDSLSDIAKPHYTDGEQSRR